VVTLTHLLRTTLRTRSGEPAGHAREMIANRSPGLPVVTGADVRGRWMKLSGALVEDGDPAGDLLLVRDVLDVQVLDANGHHRGRVGEVELEPLADGSLEVVAVQTGLRPVLHRLGLRWLAGRASFDRLTWSQLHPRAGRTHAYRTELAGRPRRFNGVLRARRRAPR
jgi:hypothetical protein